MKMGGHEHEHEPEDPMVCIKAGIFFIITIIALYFIAL